MDFSLFTQSLVNVAGLVVTTAVPIFVAWGITAFQKRTGVLIDDKNRQAIQDSLSTATGTLILSVSKGNTNLNEIVASNPLVQDVARQAIAAVPMATAAIGTTVDQAARIIVGRFGTLLGQDPTVPTVPVATKVETTKNQNTTSSQAVTAAAPNA